MITEEWIKSFAVEQLWPLLAILARAVPFTFTATLCIVAHVHTCSPIFTNSLRGHTIVYTVQGREECTCNEG